MWKAESLIRVSLVGLWLIFSTIDVTSPTLPNRNVVVVAKCYAVFMAVYLIWDVFERFNTDNPAEKQFYNKVIIWEVVALVILSAWLGVERWIPNESQSAAALAAVLVFVTIWFAVLAFKKRVFYRPPGQPPSTSPDT